MATPNNTNQALVEFYNLILATDGQRFTNQDAVIYVEKFNFGTTVDTIKRAIRNLKSKGLINYEVANLKQGIFQALPLAAPKQ